MGFGPYFIFFAVILRQRVKKWIGCDARTIFCIWFFLMKLCQMNTY